MRLSKNFSLSEFTRSMTASRKSIDNQPGKQHLSNLQALVDNVLQPARDELGRIRVNSGFRSKALNKAVGGSGKSNHCFGFAADVELVEGSNFDLLSWIHNNVEYSELIAEYFNTNDGTAGWVHVAYNPDKITKVIKLKDSKHNFEQVTLLELQNMYGANND
jgi:zinc D-Ala-D-Ala carboxypeptidase